MHTSGTITETSGQRKCRKVSFPLPLLTFAGKGMEGERPWPNRNTKAATETSGRREKKNRRAESNRYSIVIASTVKVHRHIDCGDKPKCGWVSFPFPLLTRMRRKNGWRRRGPCQTVGLPRKPADGGYKGVRR